MGLIYNLNTFKDKATLTHQGKYSYNQITEYLGCNIKVAISCEQHGDYWQTPKMHLAGQGCPKCAFIKRASSIKSNLPEFIEDAIKVHMDKNYSYPKFIYKDNKTKGIITCPDHGDFSQKPHDHLSGRGCPKCGARNRHSTTRKSWTLFTKEASEVHSNYYSYPEQTYKNSKTYVVVSCPKHGEFQQIPNDHLDGHGCPSCPISNPKWQQHLRDFIKSIYPGIILYNDRTTIKHPITDCFRELDIYLPQIKVAFECNGSYFHDKVRFPKIAKRDAEKAMLCQEAGIHLVVIWENEWHSHRISIENKIRGLFLKV